MSPQTVSVQIKVPGFYPSTSEMGLYSKTKEIFCYLILGMKNLAILHNLIERYFENGTQIWHI